MKAVFRPEKGADPFRENSCIYFVPAPDYGKDAAWLRKKISETGGAMYFSAGEAEYQVYGQLEGNFRKARHENGAEMHFLAGPILSIPDHGGALKDQKSRGDLSPAVRLAKSGDIKLYPAHERQLYTFRVFERPGISNIMEPYAPGNKTRGSWYFYRSPTEAAAWKKRFMEAVDQKKEVKSSFSDHFVFLTAEEIADLKHSILKKCRNLWSIDIGSCREFLEE